MSAETTEVLQLRADLSRMTDERNAWRSQFAMGKTDPLRGDTSAPLKLNEQREKELSDLMGALPDAARRFLDNPNGGDGDELFSCTLGSILDDIELIRAEQEAQK